MVNTKNILRSRVFKLMTLISLIILLINNRAAALEAPPLKHKPKAITTATLSNVQPNDTVSMAPPIVFSGTVSSTAGLEQIALWDDWSGSWQMESTRTLTVLEADSLAISNLQVAQITSFSAMVTWDTNRLADSTVSFGSGTGYDKVINNSALTNTHKVVLIGLNGDSCYHFKAASQDALANSAESADTTMQTANNRIMKRENGTLLVNGEPFFPIIQWLQCDWRIPNQAPLGINTFMGMGCSGDTAQEHLDTCAANDVWGIVKFDESVKDHASLLGWFWEDEPEMPRSGATTPPFYPQDLLDIYQNIKAADSHHPFFTTFTARFSSKFEGYDWMQDDYQQIYSDYINATDIPGFDHYPIYGWCRPDWIHEVSDMQDELLQYAPNKPTYQWIELAKTSSKYCENSDRGVDDGPYPYEVRNEVWQAIIHGAKAVGYFTHSWECTSGEGYSQFCLSNEQLVELTRTNGQITNLTPAILGESYLGEVNLATQNGARVDFMVKQHDNALYIFAASLERDTVTATFTLPNSSGHSAVVIDEARALAIEGKNFSDSFDALGVHIYRVTEATTLNLHGMPADSAILLNWTVSGDPLPVTSTWRINYDDGSTTIVATDTLTNTARNYPLNGLVNGTWYTITLSALLDDQVILDDYVRVMPTDRFLYLPIILNTH